jgi:subtilisin family serine protease
MSRTSPLALALALLPAAAQAQSLLPSPETQGALVDLGQSAVPTAVPPGEFLNLSNEGAEGPALSTAGVEPGQLPFIVPDSLIVQVTPNLGEAGVRALIEEYGWEVVQTFPALGQMQVRADLSEFFVVDGVEALDPNLALVTGVVAASQALAEDPRIVSATPDFVVGTQQDMTSSSMQPVPRVQSLVPAATMQTHQQVDWGVGDIEADQLWAEPGAADGAILGVLDVGFNRHEDLTYLGFAADLPIDDHGNHVAGIACATHDAVGVAGVLPSCFVAPRSGDFFPVVDEGGNVMQFLVTFSMLIDTFEEELAQDDGIRVFNLSLGYNWVSNFGINIDDPGNGIYRQAIAMQGENLRSALELAARNDIIIVSAAGNDSSSLPTPMGAKFASPFNWAAFTVAEQGLSRSGVVVEAHDAQGARAAFSNIGGHLSCPGVDVLSTVSLDGSSQPSPSAYGTMSGTSMASPYCAAGILLFRLVRPDLSSEEVLDCIIGSAAPSATGAPQMRLAAALAACPAP